MSSKQSDGTTPIDLSEGHFSELDNWLGIMDVDPPRTYQEKRVMYDRLMEILGNTFEPQEKVEPPHLNLRQIQRDMRKIIER